MPRLLTLTMILVFACAASARAGWGWPSLNPFKDSHPSNIGQKNSGWQWPGMEKKPAAQQPAGPSMWQRVSSAPKSAWTKTKSVVYPWGNKPAPAAEPVQITGSNSYFSRVANGNNKQPAKKSFWARGNEEEDQKLRKVNSVSDFIGGKRPE